MKIQVDPASIQSSWPIVSGAREYMPHYHIDKPRIEEIRSLT